MNTANCTSPARVAQSCIGTIEKRHAQPIWAHGHVAAIEYVTADGYYVYAGRTDDMLKVGGIYVSPAEVEAALISHHAVLEVAVVGRPDSDDLIKPIAYVVVQSGITASPGLADALKQHVKALLAPYKYPRWVEFVDELPKTATGKIQRFKLRAFSHGRK